MARAARIALDLALVSMRTLQPAVSRIWGVTKAAVAKTAAKPLVCNVVITQLEKSLHSLSGLIVRGVTILRNKQLPGEERYLERELDKVKQKIADNEPVLRGGELPTGQTESRGKTC